MDLSSRDLISKYYTPCEKIIVKILRDLCQKHKDLLISFIDVKDEQVLLDKSKKIVITDQLIQTDLYPEKTVLKLPDSIFGIYFIPEPINQNDINRDFNLFMNRANSHRLFWFYKMIEMELLDSGLVSYIGSTERSSHPELDSSGFVDFLHQKYYFPHYKDQYIFARQQVPFQNFNDNGDLRDIIMKTKLSVVIECYHERTDAISFSEKIFRAIQTPRPWILSGATGSVDRLRSMGFDVFDEYIDHSYDHHCTKYNTAKRDSDMLEQILRIKHLNVTPSILKDWYQKYQKNMEILSSWHRNWKKDFYQFLFDNFPDIQMT